MRALTCVASLVLGVSVTGAAQEIDPTHMPLGQAGVAQFVVAGGAGVATAVAAAYVGRRTIDTDNLEDPGVLGTALGGLAGLVVGTSLGAHVTGIRLGMPICYETSLLGTVLGFVALLPLDRLGLLDLDHTAGWVPVFAMPALGAVVTTQLQARDILFRPTDRVRGRIVPVPGGIALRARLAF